MRLLWFNLATDVDDPVLGFTTSWLRATAKQVECIQVITMRAGRVRVPDNVRVYSVGKEKGYSEPKRAVEFYRHLWRILRHDRVDACFSHMMPTFTVLAAPVLKAKRVPLVTWYAHPSLTRTLQWAHWFSTRVVSSLPTAYPYRHDKLVVLGQGIDTDLFAPNHVALPADPPMVLCVGRLSPVKDHPTLLRAVHLLRRRWDKPFQVVVLGAPAGPQDGPYAQSLRKQVEQLGLQDVVRFEPAVPMLELPGWHWRCAVAVNLTPTGFGDKVAWEAMSCGKVCLVANEGFRGTLGKYADQLLFCFGSAEDLAIRLERVLSATPESRARIGSYLREQVVSRHSLQRLPERLIALYQELPHA